MSNGDLLPAMFLPPIENINEGFELDVFHNKKRRWTCAKTSKTTIAHTVG